MLKTRLLDCAIYVKCCSVDRGRGIFPLLSSTPWETWKLKSHHPWEFALQGKKKKTKSPGSAPHPRGGGAGRSWNSLMHNLSNSDYGSTSLSMMWRIMLISEAVIHPNYILLDPPSSSHHTQPHSIIVKWYKIEKAPCWSANNLILNSVP